MEISLHSLLITCTLTISSMTPVKSHLSVVSPMQGSEQYYVMVRKKRLGGLTRYPPYPAEDPDTIKESICRSILESVLFDSAYELGPITPHFERKYPDIFDELRRKYPTIYDENFYDARDRAWSSQTTMAYQVHNIKTSKRGVYKEYLFVCPARNRRTGEIEELFISRKYDVNEYVREPTHRIEGRFVFKRNEQNELTLIALAEEPAHQSFDQNSIECIYMETIKKRVKTVTEEVDPVCQLSKARKIRLCTIVMNAIGSQGSVQFFPDESNVEPDCERNAITFLHKKKAGPFREWMIGCKGQIVATRQPITYYVSRGYKANTCYVYRNVEGRMVFDHVGSDVGVYVMPRTFMDPAR